MNEVGECLVAFLFGAIVGLVVQRSRFCNTAALRDAILFKSFRNTKALLVAMMILTIGFTGFISIFIFPERIAVVNYCNFVSVNFVEKWCIVACVICEPYPVAPPSSVSRNWIPKSSIWR